MWHPLCMRFNDSKIHDEKGIMKNITRSLHSHVISLLCGMLFFYIFCQAEDPILPAQTMKQEGCVVQECGKDQKMPRLFGHRYFNLWFGKPYITRKWKNTNFLMLEMNYKDHANCYFSLLGKGASFTMKVLLMLNLIMTMHSSCLRWWTKWVFYTDLKL